MYIIHTLSSTKNYTATDRQREGGREGGRERERDIHRENQSAATAGYYSAR